MAIVIKNLSLKTKFNQVRMAKGKLKTIAVGSSEKFEIIDQLTGVAPKSVKVKRLGDDLQVSAQDETGAVFEVVLEGYYTQGASLLGSSRAGENPIEFHTTGGAAPLGALSSGADATVAVGAESGFVMPSFGLQNLSFPGLDGMGSAVKTAGLWALGAVAVGFGVSALSNSGSGGSSSPTSPSVVKGKVTAGPVLANNDLFVVVYAADGKTELGRDDSVEAGGAYQVNIASGYVGNVVVRVFSKSTNKDYLDETTKVATDLSTSALTAVATVGIGANTINVNPITDVAARKAGVASKTAAIAASTDVSAINKAVSEAYGLGANDVTAIDAVPTVTSAGAVNPDTNLAGAVLAQMSAVAKDNAGNVSAAQEKLAASVAISKTADGVTATPSGLSKTVAAMAKIEAYANNSKTNSAPTVQDYVDAGVTGVTDGNLAAVNTAVDKKSGADVATQAKIQAVTDAARQPTDIVFSTDGSSVSGTAEHGSTVKIDTNGDGAADVTVTADTTTGAFKANLSPALVNGEVLSFTVTDAAGNISTPLSVNALDTSAPLAALDLVIAAGGKTMTGTAEAGSTVKIDTNGDGTADVTVKASSTGTFTATLPSALINGETVKVTVSDAAGNNSPVVSVQAADTTKPLVAKDASILATGTGVIGTAEAGSTVSIDVNGDGVADVTATANAATGIFRATLPNALTNGETIKITVTDAAGNTSAPLSVKALDKTAPLTPTGLAISAAGDSISGVAEPGSTVKIDTNGDGLVNFTVTASATGAFTRALTPALKNGQAVTVTVSDAAGNTSSAVTVNAPDTTVPNAASDLVISADGRTLTGTAEVGSTVKIDINGDGTVDAVVSPSLTGVFTKTFASALVNGEKVSVTVSDAAGNASSVTNVTARDITPPVLNSAAVNPNGLTVIGNSDAGATVTVKSASGEVLGVAKAGADGNYAVTLNAPVAAGVRLSVSASDAGGTSSVIVAEVNNFNDAPTAANKTLAVESGVPFAFSASHVGFSDAADVSGNNLKAVIITALPSAGSLKLNGVNVAVGAVIEAADLGKLTFTSPAGATGLGFASVKFKVQDDGGTLNGGADTSANQYTWTLNVLDTVAPTVAVSASKSSLKAGDTSLITFTFSEDPINSFSKDDVVVEGGSLSAVSGTGLTRTATFTPAANTTAAGKISVASGRFSDSAGNLNADGSESNNTVALSIDTLPPSVVITADKLALKVGEVSTITFTFNKDPGGSFAWDGSAGDIVVTGGTLSELSGTGLTRTAIFTPTQNSNLSGSVSVASGQFSDTIGNLNVDGNEANNAVALSIDTVPESVKALLKISNYADSEANSKPTVSDYVAAGVVGVIEANLAAINAMVSGVDKAGADTVTEVQALANTAIAAIADAVAKVEAYNNGNGTTPAALTLADYVAAGVTGVTVGNLAAVNASVLAADALGANTSSKIQALVTKANTALAKVEAYNNGNGTAPAALTLADYVAAGVTEVTSDNLAAVNAKVLAAATGGADTAPEIQALVTAANVALAATASALAKIEAYNNGDGTTPAALTVADYVAAGVTGVNVSNLATVNKKVLDQAQGGADTAPEVQALVTAANTALSTIATALAKIEAYNNGNGTTPAALTVADYVAAGITDVTADNLAAVNAKVLAAATGGADTASEIQALVVAVNAPLAKIEAYNNGNGTTPVALALADYVAAGVTGVSLDNLAAVNAKVLAADVLGANTAIKIQALVTKANEALAKVEAYNVGNGTTPVALALADYVAAGVTGVSLDNLAAVNAKVLAAATGGADTVPEIQALVTKANETLAKVEAYNNGNGTTPAALTLDDYAAVGVTGVSLDNLAAVNAKVLAAATGEANSAPEIQALVTSVVASLAKIEAYNNGNGNGTAPTALTVADYVAAGVTGVTAENLTAANASVLAADALGADTPAEIQALVNGAPAAQSAAITTISNYADNPTNRKPTLSDYTLSGVTGVTEDNLAAVNAQVDRVFKSTADTATKIQALITKANDALTKIEAYNNGAVSSLAVADYAAAGVVGVNSANLVAVNAKVLAAAPRGADSSPEIQTLANTAIADAVSKIETYNNGNGTSPAGLTVADYVAAGVTGVSVDNVAAVNASVLSQLAGGADSVAKIQLLVTQANNTLAKIEAYNNGNGITPATLTVADYVAAGITGVTADNLVAVNAKILSRDEGGVDTDPEIQFWANEGAREQVGALALIANYADANTNTLPTADNYLAAGIAGVSAGNLLSLLNTVVDRKAKADSDQVTEVQALADIVSRVLKLAANVDQVITQAELTNLGVANLTAGQTADLLSRIKASADDGSAVNTLAKIQALVDQSVTPATINSIETDRGTTPAVANDGATKDNTWTIKGTAEEGSTVELFDGMVSMGFASTSGTSWTFNTGFMDEGTHAISAKVTDLALNTLATNSFNVAVDNLAPTRPSHVGVSSTGGNVVATYFNSTNTGVNFTASITAGNAITDEAVGGRAEFYIGTKLVATDSVIAIGDSTVTASVLGSAITAGGKVSVILYDAAGNTISSSSINNATLNYDVTAPAQLLGDIKFSADTGASNADFITNVANQTISGKVSAVLGADEKVQVSLNNGTSWSDAVTPAGSTDWSLASQVLTASNTLKVRIVDAAGNIGANAFVQPYVFDTSAPTVTLDNAIGTDLGLNNVGAAVTSIVSGDTTRDQTWGLSGTAEAGSTVKIYDGNNELGVANLVGTSWNFTTSALAGGSHVITARVLDIAGNEAQSSTISGTVDVAVSFLSATDTVTLAGQTFKVYNLNENITWSSTNSGSAFWFKGPDTGSAGYANTGQELNATNPTKDASFYIALTSGSSVTVRDDYGNLAVITG